MMKSFLIRIGAFFRRLFHRRLRGGSERNFGMTFDAQLYMTCGNDVMKKQAVRFRSDADAEMELVKIYPDHRKQRIIGFGAALTDAAASVYAQMDAETQRSFLKMCFSVDGNAYSLCRTPIMSCDFSREPYSYVAKGDKSLASFSVKADEEVLIPMIKDAQAVNPNIEWLASPWSPPAFMKTNGVRKFGGHLKPAYYAKWADMIVRYVQAYAEHGIKISRLTIQNEPNARQTWESCLMDANEEETFAKDYVKPALLQAELDDVKVLVWDHNKDRIVERVESELDSESARAAIDGVGFHWYSGDHFEGLREMAEAYPDKEFIMTEGCVEYSVEWKSDLQKAEKYAHDIIGDLEAGAHAYIDWNILLDETGGPNHVKNFCDSPLMYDRARKTLMRKIMFDYIGHVTHFVKPGATRVLTSRWCDDVEAVSVINPDGTHACVLLNRRDWDIEFSVHENGSSCRIAMPAHSIATLVWAPTELDDSVDA